MQVTIELPDDIAGEIARGKDAALHRAVLEAVALEGYRSGSLTHAQVGRLLGIDYRFDVDVFLKQHGACTGYTQEDLERDRRALERLGV